MTDQQSPDATAHTATGSDSVDAELTAIQTVLGALRGLKTDERQRVLAYVFERLGLPSVSRANPAQPTSPNAPQAVALPATLATTADEPGGPRDIRTLKEQKKPKTAMEMAALVAYYLAELAPPTYRKATIGTDDITTYFKQADFPLPRAPRQTLFNAKAAGYFDSAERGSFKLNPVGHNLVVHGLPSTGDGSKAGSRGSRSGRKVSRASGKRAKSKK